MSEKELPQQKADELLQILKHIRKRPGMWFGETTPAVVNFMFGFQTAAGSIEEVTNVIAERGWEVNRLHPYHEMQKRGMTEAEIIEEVMTIYIEAFKKQYGIEDATYEPQLPNIEDNE